MARAGRVAGGIVIRVRFLKTRGLKTLPPDFSFRSVYGLSEHRVGAGSVVGLLRCNIEGHIMRHRQAACTTSACRALPISPA